MRGGWERTYISGDSSPICKRHLESMLKGIKSYLCLVQTGHIDVEGILFGTWKGRDQSFWITSSEHIIHITNSCTSYGLHVCNKNTNYHLNNQVSLTFYKYVKVISIFTFIFSIITIIIFLFRLHHEQFLHKFTQIHILTDFKFHLIRRGLNAIFIHPS